MPRTPFSILVVAAVVLGSAGCGDGIVIPELEEVDTPAAFVLQRLQPVEEPFTGTARVAYCDAAGYVGLRLRSPSYPGEDVTMFPRIGVPRVDTQLPLGEHRFDMFGGASQSWSVLHISRAIDGLSTEAGQPIGGVVQITESSRTELRGRFDVVLRYFGDTLASPVVRRLRGTFWAVADPRCTGEP